MASSPESVTACSSAGLFRGSIELEQRPRIVAADLLAIAFRDRRRIEPV
jgi:hypothetical protein